MGKKPKWHDYKKLQREADKTKREFGVTSPVENFESVQGDNLALSSNSGADKQHDNMSHSVHKVTSVHTQGDKSCNFGEVALKGTRARLNHQLITISPSVILLSHLGLWKIQDRRTDQQNEKIQIHHNRYPPHR